MRAKSKWIVLAAGLLLSAAVVTGLYLGERTRRQFHEISHSWAGFSDEADRKGILISRIRGYLGYGGIIHNFKNYVLRKDAAYRDAVRAQLSEFDIAKSEFLALPISDLEANSLQTLSSTMEEYRRNLEIAERSAQEGWSAEQTDKLVRVDDTPALNALRDLETVWQEKRKVDVERIVAAVGRGEGLIKIGFLSMFLLVVASLVLAFAFWTLLQQMRETLTKLSEELIARERLARSEERLAQAVEQSPAIIMITDTSGHIQYVNRHFERLSGWAREEVIGRTPRFLQSGDTSAEEYRHMQELLRQGKVWRGVLHNIRKDGGNYWIESTILPLLASDGSAHSYLAIGEDIAERREAREQLARAQKIEAVGLLAGGVAHDFNSILTAILGSAHLASLDAPEASEQMHEIEQIRIAAQRAQFLVRQLLDFARRKPGNRVPTDLCDVINQTLGLLRAATPANIRFNFDKSAAPLWVSADPTQLHQILMNLGGNAAEAISGANGSVDIVATFAKKRPPDGNPVVARWVRLDVRDNGPGMPDHIRARVFDAFYTTKPLGKGSGLGLAVVQGIVNDMNGLIMVESEPGVGTVFTLYLPGTDAPAAEISAKETLQPQGSERLLIIDDDNEVCASLRRSFIRLGYQVEAFTSSLIALKVFEQGAGRFDAVITDIVMPDLDGVGLADKLREIRPDIPIVFLTGYTPRTIDLDGPKPAIVEKPVDPLTLARALRLHLAKT